MFAPVIVTLAFVKGIQQIPNTLTLLNLLFGMIAIVFSMNGQIVYAGWMIVLAAMMDVLDGLSARILNVRTMIGGDLDSLADAVSFGVAPAMIIYKMMWLNINREKLAYLPAELIDKPIGWEIYYWPFLAFFMAIVGVIRLARFNNDTRQSHVFIGLPIPASGLFFAFMPIVFYQIIQMPSLTYIHRKVLHGMTDNMILAITACIVPLFMILPIRMFSLKGLTLRDRSWTVPFSFALIGIALMAWLGYVAIHLLIIGYIVYSLIDQIFRK